MTKKEKTTMPPSTLLNPVPVVMVSCAGRHPAMVKERANIITIAWAGTINSEPPMVSISVRPSRHSHKLISDTKEFVINLVSEDMLRACDYCGVRSGKDEDKFAAMSLTATPADGMIYAPAIQEATVSLSCKVESCVNLGTHDLFTARIVSVTANKELFSKTGKLSLEEIGLVVFSHGEYFKVGEYLGFFGYSVASKDALQRREKTRKKTTKEMGEKIKPARTSEKPGLSSPRKPAQNKKSIPSAGKSFSKKKTTDYPRLGSKKKRNYED